MRLDMNKLRGPHVQDRVYNNTGVTSQERFSKTSNPAHFRVQPVSIYTHLIR